MNYEGYNKATPLGSEILAVCDESTRPMISYVYESSWLPVYF